MQSKSPSGTAQDAASPRKRTETPTRPSQSRQPIVVSAILILVLALFTYNVKWDVLLDLPDGVLSTSQNRSALILTAHPDDEAMFFSPVILGLVGKGWDVRGLCLSSGNASGLGDLRRQELFASYDILGVPSNKVELASHPSLQDGMGDSYRWDPAIIANIVSRHLTKYPSSLIITFDQKGITNHPNHVPLSAIQPFLPTHKAVPSPRFALLRSPSVISKFTGPLYAVYYASMHYLHHFGPLASGSQPIGGASQTVIVLSSRGYVRAFRAMLAHKSQLVWFRWLYLVFSRLMWVNELKVLGL